MAVRPEILQQKREMLLALIGDAVSNDPTRVRALYNHLAKNSQLPSPRPNEALLQDFADMAGSRGKAIDRLLFTMTNVDADYAQGGTEFEFVPMCGVAGLGVRAASLDAEYPKLHAALHAAAEDLRFRVRDTVPGALARIGAKKGDALVVEVEPWMDGMFHAAAVLRALAMPEWLNTLSGGDDVVARLDAAFTLLDKARRSDSRYPGYKALVDAIAATPGIVATRFGVPVFDALVRWTKTKEPALREAIAKNLGGSKLAGRHAQDVERVRAALGASAPPRRDPNSYVGPTRGRGAKMKVR